LGALDAHDAMVFCDTQFSYTEPGMEQQGNERNIAHVPTTLDRTYQGLLLGLIEPPWLTRLFPLGLLHGEVLPHANYTVRC
jgi:hypothetical protein